MRKVSVIMPCFNHARFLEDSVSAILRQSHADLELMIVDDCSSDNSWDIICHLADGDLRIRPIRHERNLGASRSRNDGLRAATGNFIGFCDADDIWEHDKLDLQLSLLEKNPDYFVTYSDTAISNESGAPMGERFSERFPPPKNASGWLFDDLILRNFINMQSVLLRKECVERVGEFDEKIKWVEDWWFWIRVSRHHRFLYSRECLARYRVHAASTNLRQRRGYCVNRFKVFRRILREYPDLPKTAQATLVYKMGVDLCALGKRGAGHWLYRQAIRLSIGNVHGLGICCRVLRRLVVPARKIPAVARPTH